MTRPEIPALTGIRFFLALWVVAFHQTSPDGALRNWIMVAPGSVYCVLRTGYVAVGVFFVLSGFVLSYNYSLQKTWSRARVTRFALARFARIYPAYALGLLLTAPFVFSTAEFGPVKLVKQATVAVLNGLLLQAWIPRTALTWNAPGWSLSNEAFFYACFPFIGVWLWRACRGSKLPTGIAATWALSLLAPTLAVSLSLRGFGDVSASSLELPADPFWANLVQYNPLLHLPDFWMGILACRAYETLVKRNSPLIGRGYYLYVPALGLALAVLLCANRIPMPLLHNGLLLPLAALAIIGLALGGGLPARALSAPLLVLLGNASYSLYILHVPAMYWMNLAARNWIGFMPFAVYLAVVVALSVAVFKKLEEPASRMLKRVFASGDSSFALPKAAIVSARTL